MIWLLLNGGCTALTMSRSDPLEVGFTLLFGPIVAGGSLALIAPGLNLLLGRTRGARALIVLGGGWVALMLSLDLYLTLGFWARQNGSVLFNLLFVVALHTAPGFAVLVWGLRLLRGHST